MAIRLYLLKQIQELYVWLLNTSTYEDLASTAWQT